MELSLFSDEVFIKNKKFAFIDETGNYGFEFEQEGISSHYILTAVIVE